MELSVFLYFFIIICYNLNCRVPAWSAGKSGILVSAALLIFFNFTKSKTALMDGFSVYKGENPVIIK